MITEVSFDLAVFSFHFKNDLFFSVCKISVFITTNNTLRSDSTNWNTAFTCPQSQMNDYFVI